VLVRVIDTDRTAASGTSQPLLDSVTVDYLYFEKIQEDLRPQITITAVDASAAEIGADTGTIRIARPQAAATPLDVSYIVQGTATSGADYSALSNRATIPAGAAFVDVVLSPLDDLVSEGSETVVLMLVDGLLYKSATQNSATVTIADNDLVLFKATSDIAGIGTVSGDYTRTWDADGLSQSITEQLSSGKTSSQYSYLQRTWVFNATAVVKSLYLKALTTSTIDSFIFSYSTNGSVFTNFATLSPGGSITQSYALPNLTGTIYVRVVDSNRTGGEKKLETVSIDQIYLSIATPLTAASIGTNWRGPTLATEKVRPQLEKSASIWKSFGFEQVAFPAINIKIENLGGSTLALAAGNTIWLDDDAAGWGWYFESDWNFADFDGKLGRSIPSNRIDLLTVVMHEMGHLLGLDHHEEGVMAESLAAGVRRTGMMSHDAEGIDHILGQDVDLKFLASMGTWLNEPFEFHQSRNKRRW
jgi:hypothetical protein